MAKKTPHHAPLRTIVLLDMHAILHRAYHALPDFTDKEGKPTGALYGLCTFLFKVVEDLVPEYIVGTYDMPQPTHRHEAFSAYKGTREKTDDALVQQIIASRDILTAFGIPYLEAPGFEADDILGTLAHAPALKEVRIVIASGDMDTLQLVEGERVVVYTLKRGLNETVLYTEKAVRERYGFGPEQVADYKGLRGDPSDNIPGIHGIGEKTATTLITTFGSLEKIYEALAKNQERFAEAGITPRIVGLLTEGEDEARFSKELATIRDDAPVTIPSLTISWRERMVYEDAKALFSKLGFKSLMGRLEKFVQGGGKRSEQEDFDVASDVEEPEAEKEERPPEKEIREATIALWLLESDNTDPSHDDVLSYTHETSFEKAHEKIMHALAEEKLLPVYTDIELPLIPVIERMEKRGILLDCAYLKKLSVHYHTDMDALAEKIFAQAGATFNLNSPRQLGEVLFGTLNIGGGKKAKRTTTGQMSTKESELKKYEKEHPIVSDILEYRELQKLLSTYIDSLPTMVDEGGRLHARFSQTGTTTGRMSSQNPNMQNIPIKTSRGSAIRRAIVAPEGFSLLSADYSQIELRVAAFLSRDEKLIASFKEGRDIHTSVASEMFGVPPEVVDKEMRRRAKIINFGILYGMGSQALAVGMGISAKEAKHYLDAYFLRFSGIALYMEAVKEEVKRVGFTRTFFGRKRTLAGIRSSLPYVRAQAERMALNAPIQGTQADIIKIAMVRIDEVIQKRGLTEDVYLTSQIHDELLFEVRDEKVEEVSALVRETMEGVMSLEDTMGVPLLVEVEVGKNWGESFF